MFADASTASYSLGGVALELANGCWLLSEFRRKWSDAALLTTLQHQTSSGGDATLSIISDLWMPGSAMSSLAHRSRERAELRGSAGQVSRWLGDIAAELVSQLLPPSGDAAFAQLSKSVEPGLFKELGRLVAAAVVGSDGNKIAWGANGSHQHSPLAAELAKTNRVAQAITDALKLMDKSEPSESNSRTLAPLARPACLLL
jgi:hypothetical protein